MSNSDTAQFELSQSGSWYLLAGIECYLESADYSGTCDTLLLELDRLESWEREHGGYYHITEHVAESFAELRQRIVDYRDDLVVWETQRDNEWYAQEARESFTVIDGGKK